MISRLPRILLAGMLLMVSGCGYRFVNPFPAEDYTLHSVKNASPEPGLGRILADQLLEKGDFVTRSENSLSVVITRFEESVAAVSSAGVPVRQNLSMVVAWKVEGGNRSEAVFGQESVSTSYPYPSEPADHEWNRAAAVRQLAGTAAQIILDKLRGSP
ncbi:MAG: hypothetical protein JSV00_09000 [bacterium]|nr:MAG: hypothetical protein JSV00_09000 [bacterium]